MDLHEAEKLAKELMAQFGLTDGSGLLSSSNLWRFEWDDAKRRFGACHRAHGDYKITLSRELTLRNDRAKVEDTIRHEIAHALCPPKQGHGAQWKAMCKRTGAKPVRCYNEDVDAPKGDWQATCGGCGRLHHHFRRPKRDLWCAAPDCRRKNPAEYGQGRYNPICKLNFRHKNALPEPKAPRSVIEAMKAHLRKKEQAQ